MVDTLLQKKQKRRHCNLEAAVYRYLQNNYSQNLQISLENTCDGVSALVNFQGATFSRIFGEYIHVTIFDSYRHHVKHALNRRF